ncbi:MAG: hypothetical protein PF442_08790 [Desulfobulbaceae bacterium]|jgi:hypothetical protein|nr:hypothetical protein [Desulfobulbaceae bacterium]
MLVVNNKCNQRKLVRDGRAEADRIITDRGAIKGVLIDATGFDGWDSLLALMGHLSFVKEHHKCP